MNNIEITNSKTIGIVVWDPVFRDDFTFNDGSTTFTYLAGTVLSRFSGNDLLTPYLDSIPSIGLPIAVLQEDLIIFSNTVVPIRPIVAGRVRRDDLIIHNGTLKINNVESDALRDYGIIPLTIAQIAEVDNG